MIVDERAPPQIGDFQLIVLARGSATPLPAAGSADQPARSQKTIGGAGARWTMTLPRGEPLFELGAGQRAALLGCYAPNSWARIKALLVDDPKDAWPLGEPVLSYRTGRPSAAVLLAVAAQPVAGARRACPRRRPATDRLE